MLHYGILFLYHPLEPVRNKKGHFGKKLDFILRIFLFIPAAFSSTTLVLTINTAQNPNLDFLTLWQTFTGTSKNKMYLHIRGLCWHASAEELFFKFIPSCLCLLEYLWWTKLGYFVLKHLVGMWDFCIHELEKGDGPDWEVRGH
jgi:hypothetical protein